MKKNVLIFILVILSVFLLCGCTDKSLEPADKLTIYTVNDFHGAISSTNGKYGVARLGDYIMKAREEAPNETIVVSAGDMFQGSGLSYYNRGADVIEMMDIIGFDAMAIGNHEFDWSLDTILAYRDGNKKNGEADFPFLGANIIDERCGDLPEFVEPYTVFERGGLTIGIIGYIGYGLESDIAVKMVENYRFSMPSEVVSKYATELRTDKNCDVVIAVGHDGSSATNNALANLSGTSRVDAIVNGHLHAEAVDMIVSSDGRKVPVVQASSSGECVGVISFDVNQETKTLSNPLAATVNMGSSKSENSKLLQYIEKLKEETEPYFGRVIAETDTKISVYDVRKWAPNVLQCATYTDVAFVNSGGIRDDAFPISKNEKITVGKIYQIMPFDTIVKICKLKGSDIKKLLNAGGLLFSDTIVQQGSTLYINGRVLNNDEYYSVATIDYVFDKAEYPFLNGIDIENNGILYRDILIEELERLTSLGERWNPKK